MQIIVHRLALRTSRKAAAVQQTFTLNTFTFTITM
jgi:hypothetical protein